MTVILLLRCEIYLKVSYSHDTILKNPRVCMTPFFRKMEHAFSVQRMVRPCFEKYGVVWISNFVSLIGQLNSVPTTSVMIVHTSSAIWKVSERILFSMQLYLDKFEFIWYHSFSKTESLFFVWKSALQCFRNRTIGTHTFFEIQVLEIEVAFKWYSTQ